jgi:hypothetical protein
MNIQTIKSDMAQAIVIAKSVKKEVERAVQDE